MLQNCHLMKSWMSNMEQIVLDFKETQGIHPEFRLFLTSMPADYFPVSTLQNSVKMTTEPPRGLKANLKRTFADMSQQFLDDCKKPEVWRKLIFGLSFMHAVVQERRKFGPLGWNTPYEFNDSDLETSLTMLKIFLDDQDDTPWEALVFVTGHINYGGRVTDDNDRRCLLTTLEKYYCVENLEDGYLYSPSGLYYAPSNGPIEVYREYIESLPMQDAPEVFGLHENANISYQMQDSNTIVETVLAIQPRISSAGGGMTPDEVVLVRCAQLAEETPNALDRDEGKKEMFKTNNGLLPSLTTVLVQEMEKFNRLLSVMRNSLRDLKDAIHGFIVMSE
jgi:dynein heavy chain, axonemal